MVRFNKLKFSGLLLDNVLKTESKALKQIVTVNSQFVHIAEKDNRFKNIINNNCATVDGQILFWLIKFLNPKHRIEKISGSDLIYHFIEKVKKEDLRMFLLGGDELANNQAVTAIDSKDGIAIDGYSPPYERYPFSQDSNKRIIEKINIFKPDVLFVGFGAPKQEFFINDNKTLLNQIGVKWAVGCGGTFDFVSGKTNRAPKFLQNIGLEGCYRLIQEPCWDRLRRLIISSSIFKSLYLHGMGSLKSVLLRKHDVLKEVIMKRDARSDVESSGSEATAKFNPEPILDIEPAIRPQPFFDRNNPLRKSWQLNGEATVMYSGNLGGGHELDTVVRAVASLDARQQNGLRVLFIGKGKSRQSLEDLVAELSLNNIDFHDPVPLDELNNSLAVGQVHIVSQREGTQGLIVPSKIYGVMAAGRPVIFIGPEDCEPAHIIRDSQAGIVVSSGDVVGVADAIRTLTADSALRSGMGNLARDYYEKHFGLEHSTSKIISEITGTRWQEPVKPATLLEVAATTEPDHTVRVGIAQERMMPDSQPKGKNVELRM